MQAISLWLAAAIVILTGWAIVKKYQVNMVLFIAGLLLNIIGVMNGATNFLCLAPYIAQSPDRRGL